MLVDTVKDAAQLQSVLLTQILSLVELISTVLHLAVELAVAGAELLKPGNVHLCILLVLLHLANLLILHPLGVRIKLNFVSELVLNDIVHLSLDLRAFLLALCDELGHAVIGCDQNSTATFQQLCLERLIGALIRLTVKLHLHPFDLADQVGLLVSVGEEQSLVLRHFALEEIRLASDMVGLVADDLVCADTLTSQLGLELPIIVKRLLVNVGHSV